ncbi:helix-turn-helix transcriptional regulator [Filimonas effusa]|uniref:YafY family transcriptional regulator n=1 Tax=Filimonas effusa TaxID=2508721 RepID=A0A4Q1DCI5_9BACT|nr:YafY family protein [Filimonas effusa]RXK86555.1 YafY family transcriptional regulator [Filimonas effusa]
MNRIDRLFAILITLQSKKYVTADAIAAQFGMSVRTVYRDIKALTETGVPISFENQRGYFIVQGYFLPPVSFTNEEANALLLMEAITSRFADKSIQQHYTTALNKVKAVLRGTQKERLEQLGAQITSFSPCGATNDFAWLSDLQRAIGARFVVKIHYQNVAGEISEREIEPIGLIFYALNWHIIAWCHLRQEYRDFRASRILRLWVTGDAFRKQDHMSMTTYTARMDEEYASYTTAVKES